MPKYVVTIHGIDTAGNWQEQVEQVFTPHFECIGIKYPDYRRFGASTLAFGSVWLLWLAVSAIGLSFAAFVLRHEALAFLGVTCVILVGITSFFLARHKRSLVLNRFKSELDERVPFGASPHLIAHSFGTFLTGRALKKFPNVKLDRVVFTGCVLPRTFDWAAILKLNPRAFAELRNEIAARDWIPRLARFSKFVLLPGFGSAGVLGFHGDVGDVHTVDTPNEGCPSCSTPGARPAKVHNVMLREYAHSDHFVGVGHAESFWLPFFWGISPDEFQDFVEYCVLATSLEEEQDLFNLALVESELRERHWFWAGCTLEVFVERQVCARIGEGHRRMAGIVSRAVRLTWHAVRDAQREQHKVHKNEAIARRLHPRVAVCAAVSVVTVEAQNDETW